MALRTEEIDAATARGRKTDMTADINDPLALHYEFSQLNVTDLLKARDLYHFHLMNKPNVIGTAVGPSDAPSNRNVNASHNRQDTGEEKDRRLKARC